MPDARAYVIEAELELAGDHDPAAVGAGVTVKLCGHWDHEGPCRWPHNSAIDVHCEPARFWTLFIADEAESEAVRSRVEAALRGLPAWRVVSMRARPVADSERTLAERLLASPRAGGH